MERESQASTPKQEFLEVLDALPDDASMDDIVYALDIRRTILRGEAEAERGELIPHAEVAERVNRWRTSSGPRAQPRTSTS